MSWRCRGYAVGNVRIHVVYLYNCKVLSYVSDRVAEGRLMRRLLLWLVCTRNVLDIRRSVTSVAPLLSRA